MSKVHSLIALINVPTELPVRVNIISVSIKSINLPDGEVIAFDEHRKFVPSFDKSKSDTLLIASWANKDEEDTEDRITLTGEVDLASGTVIFSGGGYDSVEIEVIERLTIPEKALAEDDREDLEEVEPEEE